MAIQNIPDPYSLISEEEKEDLIQDVLNINNQTNLPKTQEEEEQEFVKEELERSPYRYLIPGYGPQKLAADFGTSVGKALGATAETIIPKIKQNFLDHSIRRTTDKTLKETGVIPRERIPGIGFGEGAASRMLLDQERDLRERARVENEEAFNAKTPAEKAEIINEYRDFVQENTEAYNKLQDIIDERTKSYNLGKNERALSAGFDSLAMMAPGLVATAATKNPSFMFAMVPAFGYYEQGSSYRQAIMSGLSHEEAVQVSNINAISEIGTELIPLPFVSKTLKKYWKNNGTKVNQFARDGFSTVLLELGGENINTVIQETNNALSGVNTELAIALKYKDDPTYNGPSWLDVYVDNAQMTSIATLVGAGGMVSLQGTAAFSPDIKRALNELDPDVGRRLARELTITANEVNANYKAIDETFTFAQVGKLFDPGSSSFIQQQDIEGPKNREYYNYVMPEILPDEFMASRIVANSTINEELSDQELELIKNLQEEVSGLEGVDLKTLLEDGKKVLNIMGSENLIDPVTFNNDIKERIKEIDTQISAQKNEDKIKKLKEDQAVLRRYLANQQQAKQPLAQKRYGDGFGTDITLRQDEPQRKAQIGAVKSLIDQKIMEPSSPSAINNVKQNIVLAKKFDKANMAVYEDTDPFYINFNDKKESEGVDSVDRSVRGVGSLPELRDFNDTEVNAVSEAINNLIEMGLPKQVFEGIPFMGIHSNMVSNEMEVNTATGQYFHDPSAKYITLAASQIPGQFVTEESAPDFAAINQANFNLGSLVELQGTLAHEIGHHIDFGFVQFKQISAEQEPLSVSSPLFEPIDFNFEFENILRKNNKESILDLTTEELKNYKFETGGPVMQEMFNLYINNRDSQNPYSGQLFSYPFDRFLISAYKTKFPMLDGSIATDVEKNTHLRSEVFAQMVAMNYTNPKLFDNYPNSKKLLQDINNVFINNGLSQIGRGLRDAFQSDRSDADSKVYTKRLSREAAQTEFGYESTSEGMAGTPVKRNRNDIRLPVQESNYVEIGDLKPKPDNTFAGAPRTQDGGFRNTTQDFKDLVQDLVSKAEQKDLSLIDESRHWYRNVNQEIDGLTQGDQQLKENVLRMLTIYSSQTPVEANLAYTLRSLVALAKGNKPLPGFQPEAGEYAEAAMNAKDFGQKLPGVGFKLQSFYENLTNRNPNAVTMDTWMFKLLGFEKGQSAIANHRYGTAVIQEAAAEYNKKNNDNLTPMEMQAVLWTWVRNKQNQEQGKPAEYIGYETYLDAATAVVTAEVIPTKNVDEYAFAEKMSEKQKVNMTREMLDMLTTSEGKNEIMDILGGTGLYKFSHSFGAYDGQVNPNILTSLVLEKTAGERQFDQNDLDFADEFLRAWGYIFTQDAMPYFAPNENISDEAAFDVNDESVNVGSVVKFINKDSGAPFEITSLLRKQINEALAKEGIDGFTQVQQDSISLINFKFAGSVTENFNEKIEKAISSLDVENVGFAVEHDLKYNTQYLENNWEEKTDGQSYLQGRLEERSIQDGLIRLRSKAQQIINKYRNNPGESTADGSFPTTGTGSSTTRPLASRVVPPSEAEQNKIDELVDNIQPPTTPPPPPSGVDPDGKFSLPEMGMWADRVEDFNITVANKFGRVWTIEESILSQFGNNEIVSRLQENGIDPDSRDWRVTTQTDIMQGRVKDKYRDLREKFYEPLLQYLVDNKITEQEYNHFIYNLHAPERNKYLPTLFTEALQEAEANLLELESNSQSSKNDISVAKRKVTILKRKLAKAQTGSGIATEDAIATLKKYGVIFDEKTMTARGSFAKGKRLLKAFNDFHAPMIANTRKLYIDSGLIPEQTVKDWDARYKYYVPLKGFAEDTLIDPETGRELQRVSSSNGLINTQMTVTGTLEKKAVGRESEAAAPLQQSVAQATAAVIESEKNRVTKSLADLARAFPSDLWEVSEDVGQIAAVDAKWDPTKGKSRVGFKEDGVQKYVEIYDRRLARGFDNFDSNVQNWALKAARAGTRYLSMVNTSLDPAFMINNFLRDVQTGWFNLLAEQEIEGGRAKGLEIAKKYYTTKNILTNAIYLSRFEKARSLNSEDIQMELDSIAREGVDITPEVMKSVQDKYKLTPEQTRKEFLLTKFKQFGGETGYIEQKTVEQLTEEFQDLQDMYSGNFRGTRKAAMKSLFGVIERANIAIENASRFTAFEGYIESMGGIESATPAMFERAAALSKNLTINFNRMGTMGPTMNALYMFFNASIQGTVNVFRGLKPGNVSSRKAKAVMGLAGLGTMQALYNILMSGEDPEDGRLLYSKIPEWERQTKYIVMFPGVSVENGEVKVEKWGTGSKYYTFTEDGRKTPVGLGVPMPYGYAIFANTGRITTELALAKVLDNYDRSLAEAGLDLGESFLHNYSPLSISLPNADDERKIIKTLPAFLPTLSRPFGDLLANRDFFGAPITYESFFDSDPVSYREKTGNFKFVEKLAQAVNDATGGNEFYKGDVDWDPSVMQYLIDYAGGGLLRTGRRTYNVAFSPEQQRSDQIPFARRVTAGPRDSEDRAYYYKNIKKLKAIESGYRNLDQSPDPSETPDEFLRRVDKTGRIESDGLINLQTPQNTRRYGNNSELAIVEKEIKELRQEKADLRDMYQDTDPVYYEKEKDRLEFEELVLMKQFNRKYREATKQ